jgi:hypothetical protein
MEYSETNEDNASNCAQIDDKRPQSSNRGEESRPGKSAYKGTKKIADVFPGTS